MALRATQHHILTLGSLFINAKIWRLQNYDCLDAWSHSLISLCSLLDLQTIHLFFDHSLARTNCHYLLKRGHRSKICRPSQDEAFTIIYRSYLFRPLLPVTVIRPKGVTDSCVSGLLTIPALLRSNPRPSSSILFSKHYSPHLTVRNLNDSLAIKPPIPRIILVASIGSPNSSHSISRPTYFRQHQLLG